MFKVALVSAALAAALAGCSATQITADANALAGGINAVATAASSPAATTAANNLRIGASAILCGVADVTKIGAQVEAQISAGAALIKDTQDVYVATSGVCVVLGGSVIATNVTVPANALNSLSGL